MEINIKSASSFRPVTFEITFTSKEELDAFKHLISLDKTVPSTIKDTRGLTNSEQEKVGSIMRQIKQNLSAFERGDSK